MILTDIVCTTCGADEGVFLVFRSKSRTTYQCQACADALDDPLVCTTCGADEGVFLVFRSKSPTTYCYIRGLLVHIFKPSGHPSP